MNPFPSVNCARGPVSPHPTRGVKRLSMELSPTPLKAQNIQTLDKLFCFMEIRAIISEDHRLNPEVAEEHDSDDEDCQGPQVKDLIHEFSYDGSSDSIVSVSMEFCSSLGCQGDTYLFTWDCNELYIQDCSINGFSSETLMLINLIEFLKAMRPQLLIGYNCDKFTFPFLISRCNHLMIDVNFQFDGYTPYVPTWFKRWCKTSSFGPFHCLDLNSVLKSLYKFKGGRFLENVTQIMLEHDQKNWKNSELIRILTNPLYNIDEAIANFKAENNVSALSAKQLFRLKTSSELKTINDLWKASSTRPRLLQNAIDRLHLLKFIACDLFDGNKQKIREKCPMKVIKRRLTKVVTKSKIKVIESCVKRSHHVRVRGTHFLKHF
ncbi:hypothetical protein GEMRC1_014156 [Eukaryota sp. GEM-RC1]